MKGAKTPWVAAALAFVLGGPGWFYLGWRRGAKATLGWLLLVSFILVNAKLLEPTVFFLILLQVLAGWKAYRSCKRSNAEAAKVASSAVLGTVRPDGVTRSTGRKPLTRWRRAVWILGKSVFVVVGVMGLMMVLFFVDLGLVDWHYKRMQRSVRSGMTIEQVLHTVQESGGVNGYPQHPGDEKIPGVHLYGPQNGTYFYRNLKTNQSEELPEGEAAALLRQNIVPGCNYRIGFTFTPMPPFVETFMDNGYYDMWKIMKALRDVNYDGIVILDHSPLMVGGNFAQTAYGFAYMKALLNRANAEAEG